MFYQKPPYSLDAKDISLARKRAGSVRLCGGIFISLKSALRLVLCLADVPDKTMIFGLLFTLYFNNKFRDIYDVLWGKMVLLNWLSIYKHSSLLVGEIGQYLTKLHLQHHSLIPHRCHACFPSTMNNATERS